MCGFIDDAFGWVGDLFGSFDNILQTVATVGSFVPGPWQVPAMMTNGVLSLADDNLLGAGLSFLGAGNAGGMFSGMRLPGMDSGGGMLGGLSDLASGASSGGGGLLGSTGGLGSGGGLFSGMSLPGVGGGSAFGAADMFGDMFSNSMAGASGLPQLGGGLGTSQLGSIGGLASMYNPDTGVGDALGASLGQTMPVGMDFASPDFTAALGNQVGGGDLMGTLQNFVEKATTGPGGQLTKGLLGGIGAYKDYRGARKAQKAFQGQLDRLDQLYAPDSPYAKQMEKTLARRDAARGRRSQYGPRAQELASNLTQNQANIWNSPQYNQMLGAVNQSAVPWGSAFGAANNIMKGLGGLFR